jgi:hypothetical protein
LATPIPINSAQPLILILSYYTCCRLSLTMKGKTVGSRYRAILWYHSHLLAALR